MNLRSEDQAELLRTHIAALRACRRCANMHQPVVSGGAVVSKVVLIGQAPGDKEPLLGRPFAWTAGRTLFRWFNEATGLSETEVRESIYIAAACRCFPGKKAAGGDRVPSREEVHNCSPWRNREFEILRPELVLPVGKLAISQFLPAERLEAVIGKQFRLKENRLTFDLIPLPHPSGASSWHRMEPGKTLLAKSLQLLAAHLAVRTIVATARRQSATKA